MLAAAHAQARDELLFETLPSRRLRANPRVVKRKMSNFAVKRAEHRHPPRPTRAPAEAVRILSAQAPEA
ncbi:MAG: hypothetical protein ACREMZ_17065 [Gemmatimonadales bacterium]